MRSLKKIALTSVLLASAFTATATSFVTEPEYKVRNEELVKEFEAKPIPDGIDGIYMAGYVRQDGSGEFGELWAYIDADAGKLTFIANIINADKARWGDSSQAIAMGGDFYFEGSVLKVKKPYGEKSLWDDGGAAVTVVSDDHFQVHYYDRDAKKQVLDYIKQ